MIVYTVRIAGLTHEQVFRELGIAPDGVRQVEAGGGPERPRVPCRTSNDAGGYCLVEASDPKAVTAFVSKFNFWVDTDAVPVIDISESAPISHASLAWARGASKG